ncbi:MAG: HD domain-containing protein [Sulfuricella denitrificans]|nr:HD domain-containing protein [Sulfuricella denitrificans]
MDQTITEISNPDPYYLKIVSELSESAEVVSHEDIYSQNGIKLIGKDTRLDNTVYERLIHHKLAASPIDRSLSVKGGVTPHSLAIEAARLIDEDDVFGCMAGSLPDTLLLRNALGQIVLNPPLAFKLTLAREKRPLLYMHSIRVALISLFLGASIHLKPEEMKDLAMAALFHDLGELHIDPALLDPAHALSDKERQHIYVHPMIAYLILKEYPEYHPNVSMAVLDHHERLDGSGYPRNIKGDKINPLSQILAVAEVTGSLCGREDQTNAYAQVEVILKFNSGQFRSDMVGHLSAIKRRMATPVFQKQSDITMICSRLDSISKILADWNQTFAPFHGTPLEDCLAYVSERLTKLEIALFDAGYNSVGEDALTLGIEEDKASLSELDLLVTETGWQLRDVIFETRRRWPDLATTSSPSSASLRAWIDQAERLLWSSERDGV